VADLLRIRLQLTRVGTCGGSAGQLQDYRGSLGTSGASYASVIAIDFEGQRQYVQLASTTLVGVAASDGKWRGLFGGVRLLA